MRSKSPPGGPGRAESETTFLSDLYGHAEKTGKVSFVVLALLFALGLIITNTYLLQFGLSEFGLLRARFVLTGLLAVIPTMVNLACLVIAYLVTRDVNRHFTRKSQQFKNSAAVLILILVGIVLPIVILGVVYRKADFTDRRILDALLIWSIGFLPILPFFLLAIDRLVNAFRRRQAGVFEIETELLETPARKSTSLPVVLSTFFVAIGLLIAGLIYLELFVRHIYPDVPEQFGGGQPHVVLLLFRTDSLTAMEQMHIPIQPGSNLSEPLTLLWHGNSGMLVRVPYQGEETVILIDDGLISAIVFDGK